MNRRKFLFAGVGGVAWPLSAGAQQDAKLPRVGFLGTATASAWRPNFAAFAERMHDLGWIDGSTVTLDVRWANGREERYLEVATELVRLRVNVIVTSGAAVAAAKQATADIPIVFAAAVDPLGTGLVTSLARPGANVTGLSLKGADLAGKRLELSREMFPGLARLAVLGNASYPAAMLEMGEVQTTARALGLNVIKREIRGEEDITAAVGTLKGDADALYVCADPLVNSFKTQINALAITARLPTIHLHREYVEAGGLMSYGPNFSDLFRRAADYVDKVLKGVKPGEIPVEEPRKLDFVVNLNTARSLGLTISPSLLARADEVIE
jgi:putative ABC transport system substrate-binding protein